MVQRITFLRRKSYNTVSNKRCVVRTPGGRLAMQFLGKRGSVPVCGDTGKQLYGIPALRPFEYKSLAKRKRSVSRAYGGSLCASAVRQRYVPFSSFLLSCLLFLPDVSPSVLLTEHVARATLSIEFSMFSSSPLCSAVRCAAALV